MDWRTPFKQHHPFGATTQPVWQWLWPLMLAGLVLRLLLSFNTHWILRPDEQIQYLEQAHRIVFGYGVVPWEYRVGARNWLISYPAIFALYLAKGLGLEQPWNYDLVVKTVYCLISMVIPLSMYHLVRRLSTEVAGRAALLLGLCWYEMLIFAHRSLSEPLATALIFAMLGLARIDAKPWRIGMCGFLLGIAFSVRVAYAPACAFAGLVLLVSVDRPRQIALCTGGIAALFLWGLVDKLTWGGWYESIINYSQAQLTLKPYANPSNTRPGYIVYLPRLIALSAGLFLLVLALGLWRYKQHWFLLGLFLILLVPHSFYSGAEYTNLFIAIPVLLGLGAAVWGQQLATITTVFQLPPLHKLGAGFAIGACLLGGLTFNPITQAVYRQPQLFLQTGPVTPLIDYLARQPATDVKSVLLLCGSMLFDGGYYRLHQYIPVIESELPTTNSMAITADYLLIPQEIHEHGHQLPLPTKPVAGIPLQHSVSHIIACDNRNYPGFTTVMHHGTFHRLLVNKNLAQVHPPPPKFDLRFGVWHRIENELKATGKLLPKEVYLQPPVSQE